MYKIRLKILSKYTAGSNSNLKTQHKNIQTAHIKKKNY